jgi:hypothetical protein
VKLPQWLAEEIAAAGARLLDGNMSRTEAETAIAAAARNHPAYCAQAGEADALRHFGKWIGEHASSGDLFQVSLFPDLPAVMRVAPNRSTAISDMTGEELDHARNMLIARTDNAVAGAKAAAERERAAFARLYDKVRPLLKGDLTVGDVLDGLLGEEDHG